MSFVVTCHSCGGLFSALDTADGKTVNCPKCGQHLELQRPEEITDADLDELFGITSKSASATHGVADSHQPSPPPLPFPVIVTDAPKSAKKWPTRQDKWTNPLIVGAIAGALTGCAASPLGPTMIFSAIRWAILGIVAGAAYKGLRYVWQQNIELPLILRLMKIATISWLAAMVLCALVIYFGAMNDVYHNFDNGFVIDNRLDLISVGTLRARALSGAIMSGLVIPTLFYVPTMIVLFVFWFVERQSQESTKGDGDHFGRK